ncbi:NAD(P)/FAD-dependent oxidoreductase [Roseibium sp. RKSG952]|uniref:FAD-dependent oxidoreductase n=1 Tax=Roseibium sp. RKSG952 TaxID=2529384 RepID=UPI0012BBC962|nr:FAD-dependent monooxygenase [Roseibium sp. RKSG952]MTH95341.1 monooxygenase [Roseibium sp. RKSG952]
MKIAIIGAGLNGLAVAALLQKFGLRAQVFERANGPRDSGSGIFIWPQGVQVLQLIAGNKGFLRHGQPIEFLDTHDRSGKLISSVPVRLPDCDFLAPAVMFRRAGLLRYLNELLPEGTVSYGKALTELDHKHDQTAITFNDGTTVDFDVVIAADGVFSSTRQALTRKSNFALPVSSGLSATRGMVRFRHPDLLDDRCQIFSNIHSRCVTYPVNNATGQRYWFVAYQVETVDQQLWRDDLLEHIDNMPQVFRQMISVTRNEDVLCNHLHSMSEGSCWTHGNVAFLGDSAHALLPSLGYGFTLGLENGYVLAQTLAANCDAPVSSALQRYEKRVAKRSEDLIKVMDEVTRLFYFDPEGNVSQEALKPIMGRFRNLSGATVS